jgi:hypothetical protein
VPIGDIPVPEPPPQIIVLQHLKNLEGPGSSYIARVNRLKHNITRDSNNTIRRSSKNLKMPPMNLLCLSSEDFACDAPQSQQLKRAKRL